MKGGGWGVGSGPVGVHVKAVLAGELFAVSRNLARLGGAVSPQPARPQDVKASKTENKKHDRNAVLIPESVLREPSPAASPAA